MPRKAKRTKPDTPEWVGALVNAIWYAGWLAVPELDRLAIYQIGGERREVASFRWEDAQLVGASVLIGIIAAIEDHVSQ